MPVAPSSLPPLVPGSQYGVTFRRKSGAAFVPSAFRIQFVFDAPRKYSPGLRLVRLYDPTGVLTSPGVTAAGGEVTCVLSPAVTKGMQAFGGDWSVYATVGPEDQQTVPVPRAWNMLPVHAPGGGFLPHDDTP